MGGQILYDTKYWNIMMNQYWIGAKVIKGSMRGAAVAELNEHAQDESKHAGMLVGRIIQLGGTPPLRPEDWLKKTNCVYDAPDDPLVKKVVEQNIKGEQCAIEVYKKLLDVVKDKDVVTQNMLTEILTDEVEHEEDLESLFDDMNLMKG